MKHSAVTAHTHMSRAWRRMLHVMAAKNTHVLEEGIVPQRAGRDALAFCIILVVCHAALAAVRRSRRQVYVERLASGARIPAPPDGHPRQDECRCTLLSTKKPCTREGPAPCSRLREQKERGTHCCSREELLAQQGAGEMLLGPMRAQLHSNRWRARAYTESGTATAVAGCAGAPGH